MIIGDKKEYTFRIVYFKPNGKFYTDTNYIYRCDSVKGAPYMYDIVSHIRGLRDSQSTLPGLADGAVWDGHITIDHPDGFPCLIPATGKAT